MDGAGSAYVTGYTDSTDFPTTAGAVQATHAGGDNDAFVTKLNAPAPRSSIRPTWAAATMISAIGIAVDAAGSAYVTGNTVLDRLPDDRWGDPDDQPAAPTPS